MKISQVVTRKDAEDALAVLDALDQRLLSPEGDAIRGDFGDAMINALRSALRSCWRVEDANADEDVDYSAFARLDFTQKTRLAFDSVGGAP